ncbi:MAG: DinB family protein [Chitinophagaceae bacterium]
MARPTAGEYGSFYQTYINYTQADSIHALIQQHAAHILQSIQAIPAEKADYAYAPGKWTIKQMLQHMLDTERIFVYRLIWIARGDKRALMGFDENAFADAAPATHRSLTDLVKEFTHLRNSTDVLMQSLQDTDLHQISEASGYPISVNALCYIIYGHNLHHLRILSERYL